jgi:hypothetical protein
MISFNSHVASRSFLGFVTIRSLELGLLLSPVYAALDVQSRQLMGWIESKSERFFLPAFTDESIDGKTSESLGALSEVVCGNEVGEVGS